LKYMILGSSSIECEAIPGSPCEKKTAALIASLLREYVDEIRIIDTPVLYWSDAACKISAGNDEYVCKALPYTLSVSVDGEIALAEIMSEGIGLDRDPRGKIVLAEFPMDIPMVKYLTLRLAERGAIGLILYDPFPGRYRRIVVTGDYGYETTYGSPPPIPVVSIRKEDYMDILKKGYGRIKLEVVTHIDHNATGKTVVGRINGSRENEIHLTTHHDHWFNGYSSGIAGVEALLQLARRIRKRKIRNSLVLISYTGHISGSPGYASRYWAWGARYYLNTLEKRGLLENITADLNLDMIYSKPTHINGNPLFMSYFPSIPGILYSGYDGIYLQSYAYTEKGIPAATLHNLMEMKYILNTDLDDEIITRGNIISWYVDVIDQIIKNIDIRQLNPTPLIEYVKRTFGEPANPALRALIYRAREFTIKIASRPALLRKYLRELIRTFTSTVCVRSTSVSIRSGILTEAAVLEKILVDSPRLVNRRVVVSKIDDKTIMDMFLTMNNIMELPYIKEQILDSIIQKYNLKLDKILSEILMNNAQSLNNKNNVGG
jgi:Iap family predicted aminopeptidase